MAASIAMAAAVMAAAVPGASAGFRYVPPAKPVPEAIEPVPDVIESAPGQFSHAGPGGWQVHAGETLRATLNRWGARAGVDVLFLTDRRYRLGENRTFGGAFAAAARTLFAALAHLPRPPVGELSNDGRTLTVLHRAPNMGDER